MFIEPESASWLLPEHDQPENIHLILIMLRWAFIAALAWGEYVSHGRGMAIKELPWSDLAGVIQGEGGLFRTRRQVSW